MDRDTIIAPITAIGLGSVNVLRVSGKRALEVTQKHFNKKIDFSFGNRTYFGKIKTAEKPIDDVVISFFKSPRSFTGEDVVEISCHGNYFITNEIIDLYLSEKIRHAEPGEFSKRAFLNGKIDLIQAEAIADLISAKTQEAVDNSLKLLDGNLSSKINTIKTDLLSLASLLELQIDFSEEDIDFVSLPVIKQKIETILTFIAPLIRSFSENQYFNRALKIVILGKPNVGKSSIMNGLLNQERVIVSDEPGTTRDTIHEEIEINGFLFRFIDTAGIRLSENQIEKEGVFRAKKIISTADLVLLVFDSAAPRSQTDRELIQLLKDQRVKFMTVANKSDLSPDTDIVSFFKDKELDPLYISAKKDLNLDLLKERISSFVEKQEKTSDLVITNKRQFKTLYSMRDALFKAEQNLLITEEPEFIAFDLRTVISFINELSGGITTDDILNNIFSSFCIGK